MKIKRKKKNFHFKKQLSMQVQSDIGQVRKWHSYKVIGLKVGRTKVLYTNNQRDKK